MAKECETCVHKSDFKAIECGTCMVGYIDGVQQSKPSNYKAKPMTNADRLRSMTDEELATVLYNGIDAEYCSNDPVCGAMLDEPGGIPEEKCIACAVRWLQQPAGEVTK